MEESTEYQELSRYKPHVLLTQENTQIKDLQHENRGKMARVSSKCLAFLKGIPDSTLCAVHRALSLSGGAPVRLELIMGRYRKQMLQLMMEKKELDTKPVLSLHQDHAKVPDLCFLKRTVHTKMRSSCKCTHPQCFQDVDEFVSSSEQIWRNVSLHHLLTNGSSAVNGCRQNESPNS